MQELISVIVTIYNTEAYLEQCLDSVCSQTHRNLEIILVDDGSDDRCPDICDTYAQRDDRVTVIHKENEGAVRARKAGYEASRGQYISMIDSDDWLEPDMLEKLHEALITQQVDISMCGRYEDSGKTVRQVCQGIPAGRYGSERLISDVFPNMIVNKDFFEWGLFPSFWDKLFKKESLMPYIMDVDDRLPMGNDAACVYPCLLNADSIYILDECLYHYRQTPASMVRRIKKDYYIKEGFRRLYHTVNAAFEKYSHIYDLRKQWLEYVLFLMVSRADALYEDMEKADFLFPFPGVKKGSNIILYGMGDYGKRLYCFLEETKFCNVVAAVDRNYEELCKQGFAVKSPETIEKYDYDAVVVALSFAKTRKSVYDYLIKKCQKDKIFVMDEELIKDESTLKAFGLM